MTTPTREQVVHEAWLEWKPDAYVDFKQVFYDGYNAARADLEATIEEQAKEIAELKAHYKAALEAEQVRFRQLAATQATNRAPREALNTCTFEGFCDYDEVSAALALPADDSALNAALDAEREACANECWYDLTPKQIAAAIRARKEKA